MSARVMMRMRFLVSGLAVGSNFELEFGEGMWRQTTHWRSAPFLSQPALLVVQS